jgi:hypothetical protein
VRTLSRDLFLLFGLALVPLLLLAVSALFDRLHRARVERLMKRSAATLDPVAFQELSHARGPLVLRYLDVPNVGPVHGVASRALIGAADATRDFATNSRPQHWSTWPSLPAPWYPRLCHCRPLATASRSRSIAYTVHRCVCFSGTSWIPCACVCSSLLHTSGWALRSCCSHRARQPPRSSSACLRTRSSSCRWRASIFLLARRLRPVLVGLSALVLFAAISMGIAASVYPLLGVDLDAIPSVRWWIWVVRDRQPTFGHRRHGLAAAASLCALSDRDGSMWAWAGDRRRRPSFGPNEATRRSPPRTETPTCRPVG